MDILSEAGGINFMTHAEFDRIKGLVSSEFGIRIKGDKRLTIHAKLSHRLGILGIRSYGDYFDYMASDPLKEELLHFMSHITNNETYFMREATQLRFFQQEALPEIKRLRQAKGENRVNIFSAGCSSGEELYTLNILIMESGLFAWGWDVTLTGLDVSRAALKKAERAVYTRNSFRGLNGDSGGFIKKHFDSESDGYSLKRPYRGNVRLRQGNVLESSSLDGIRDLDAIFCRNILIYMTDDAIRRITENFHRSLSGGGYLFLGASESLLGKTDLFVPECRDRVIFYRKSQI